MKKLIYSALIGSLLISLTACGSKDRISYYPSVYNGDGEPELSQKINFTRRDGIDITPIEKIYLNMVISDTSGDQDLPRLLPSKTMTQPVDVFNLGNEVSVP